MKCVWVILFLHWSLSGAQRFNVEGPDTVFAAPGSDIVLPCSIKPTMSAVDMEVKWSRQDLGDILVHHYMNNSDKNDGQMPSYRGRTALFIEQLQYGNTSLLLKNVEVSDGGQYTCRVDSAKWDGQVRVLLKIEDHLPRDYTAAIVVPVVLILLSALVGVMYFTWRD
ncbi:myelin-oligodendrocyte glycoprotein-like isoform X2 [Electrophorus electricus]|uniref:myelin-oligodendrocyte glycoprotein-like isoform X2 n=1 Tax=Electrophorus electricus TaxID=8005 RepID=UPI0015D08573|nr:myelin-oligodendrocyte glycoprotein-like isoform X2 [Electrophorus electricus]